MHAFHLSAIACFIIEQALTTAEPVRHALAPRNTPANIPYTGKPEDFASFADVPLWPYQSFVTEPDFHPPVLEISKQAGATDGLLVFAPLPFLPVYPDRFAGGLIMDQLGNPIWHSPTEALGSVNNVEVGGFFGVLKYWSGGFGGNFIDAHGFGNVTILSNDYRQTRVITLNDGTFKAGDSLQNKPQPSYIDIHENLLTPNGTLIVTAYNSTPFDLSSVGGPEDGWVLDALIYEIDLKTNKTLFRWSAIEHVDELPLNNSHQLTPDGNIIDGTNATNPWDYFLINAIHPLDNGYIISVRHYWSVVALDAKGNVKWNLNGKDGGDFKLVEQSTQPSTFSWQHYVRPQDGTRDQDLTITMFNNNNGGLDNGTAPSTGLTLYLDLQKRTARTISILQDPTDIIYAVSQGTYETLPDNHTFIAYGQIPKFKEFDANGKVVMNARFGNDNQVSSYRAFLISNTSWSATPYYPPKIAVTHLQNGTVVLSMSWNGATPDVYDTWLVSPNVNMALNKRPLSISRTGFETNMTLPLGTKLVSAAAAKGRKLIRTSETLEVVLPSVSN